ncbi:MAG TPA: hypothetical protein VI386_04910 [Candidatus Sulfotelmatobacter sp.]
MLSRSASRQSRWYGIPVRVSLITFVGTLLSFAVILFLAITGTVMVSKLRGVHPDMTVAYRVIALPAAVAVGVAILVTALILEIRRYRRMKALSTLERMN